MTGVESTIAKDLDKIAAQDLYNIDQGDFKALQVAAADFLAKTHIVSDAYQKAIGQKTVQSKIRAAYTAMKEDTNFTQNILTLAHDFERAVNNFLGRTIYLTYVKSDGSFLFYDDANIGRLS